MSAQTLLFMDGWMAATPGVPEDYGSVELSSSITSSSVVPEPRLLLLIHLRNKIHYTTPPPHYRYILTLTHTRTHTSHCPSVPPDWGRGAGRMWDQLVISSDKETCWMCSCIKKNLRSLTLLFLHSLNSSVSLFRLWCSPILYGG